MNENKLNKSLVILNQYDNSKKSAQDAQKLIYSMQELFENNKVETKCEWCDEIKSDVKYDQEEEMNMCEKCKSDLVYGEMCANGLA